LIDVSDIVQYLYCPRKLYFIRVVGLKLTRPKMDVGKEVHENVARSLARRKVEGEILENVYLESQKYGIKGCVDAIIKRRGEYIPVDIKFTRFKSLFYQWKMQLVAYAVLVEENFDCKVKKAYVYLTEGKDWIEVEITPEDRKALVKIIKEVREIIGRERYPKISKSKKCNYCEVAKFCV
jgi:CRISPR-associated exonuclease Cas4